MDKAVTRDRACCREGSDGGARNCMSVSMGSVWIGMAGGDANEVGVASTFFLHARKLVFALGRGLCSPPAASSGAKADIRAFAHFRSHENHPISARGSQACVRAGIGRLTCESLHHTFFPFMNHA